MENRERDRVSQRTTPTEAGELNRRIEEEKGRQHHSGTTAEFGQNIGESEFPTEEGGNLNMRNRDEDNMKNRDMNREFENESSRRSGQGSMGSSSGRSSGSRSTNEIGSSDRSSDENRRGSSGELGSTGSSSGRH